MYTGTTATPRRSDGSHAAAIASGVKASWALVSDDQTSV